MKKCLLSLFILLLASHAAFAQVVVNEGFESGLMPPPGWSSPTSLSFWFTTGDGEEPTCSPHSGSYMAEFNSYDWPDEGSQQTICTPPFSLAALGTATDSVSFWIYRDHGYSTADDDISIYIGTSADMIGATLINSVARSRSIAEPDTHTSDGWYQYTFAIPTSYTGSVNYLFFVGTTQYGDNIFIDDISYSTFAPPCAGTPIAGTVTGPSVGCASVGFTLGLTGDSVAAGLTYVWKASTDGGVTFTTVAGATNSTYFVASQTVATEYKLIETCTSGAASDSTPAFSVGETICYCTTPSWEDSEPLFDAMDEFALTGYSGSSLDITGIASSADPSTGYLDLTTIDTINLQQGGAYPLTVTFTESDEPWENQVWIDFNDDGIFADVETVTTDFGFTTSSTSSASTTLNVPITATSGYHRMRARTAWVLFGSSASEFMDPCANSDADNSYFEGDVIDLTANIIMAPPCSGTPTAGTITGPASVCSGLTGYSLSLTGDSVASGLTFQWYSAPSGGTLVPITGATTTSYSAGPLTAAIDYEVIVTCTSSGLSDTTPVFTEGVSPFYICYCGPNTDGSTLTEFEDNLTINEVSIPSTGFDNLTPGTSTPLYELFYPTTPTTTATLNEGSTYTVIVDNASGFSDYSAAMWIDYNQNGVFDDGTFTPEEFTDITDDAPPGTASAATFVIPSTGSIVTGLTGMRIRMAFSFDAMSDDEACTNLFEGSTQDYVINIQPGVPCTGTPAGGTALAGQPSACALSTFALSDTGFTNGLGMTYQWCSRPTGSTGAYTAISGATNSYYAMTGQTVATDYIFTVECTLTTTYDTSSVVSVAESPFYLCYCSPALGSPLGDDAEEAPINEVSITGTTLDNIDLTDDVVSYKQFWPTTASTTTDLNQGNTYTMNVTSEDGFESYNAAMWIDYNQDGDFTTPASEWTLVGTDVDQGVTASASFHVPSDAVLGLTGLRVMTNLSFDDAPASGDACTNFYEQSTQDYVINIVPGIPCSGTPVAGTAFSPATTACTLSTFNLNDTAFTNGLGVEYKWYTRPTGSTGAYTAIPGATGALFSMTGQPVASDYIFVVKCDSALTANTDTSNVISIAQSPFYLCYCSPLVGTTLGDFGDDAPINGVSITGTTLDNTDFSDAVYEQFWPVTTSTTAFLTQAVTYTVNVTSSDGFGENFNAVMWIDYDHSGTFDATGLIPSEYTFIATNADFGSTASATFTIPETADTGATGLRIMVTPSFTSTPAGDDACTNFFEQATQDYVINILPGTPCGGTPTAGIAIAPATACPTAPFTLSDTSATTGLVGISYQWQSTPTGTGAWTNITGATTPVYTATELVASDYRLIVSCTATSTLYDTSTSVTVGITPPSGCFCTDILWTFSDDPITDFAMSDFSVTGYGTGPYSSIADLGIDGLADPITGYLDHSFDTVQFQQSGAYPVSIDFSEESIEYETQGWIDFNDNGVFEATEVVTPVFGFDPDVDASSATGTFTMPAAAPPGYHKMRVRNTWLQFSSFDGTDYSDPMDPCAAGDAFVNYGTGDVVDYTAFIIPTVCDTVLTLAASDITDTTAIISWSTVGGAPGYEYVVDGSATAPTGSGTATADTTDSLSGLAPGIVHYVHVRTSCGAGTFSAWETISFVTGVCDTVIGLTASDISDTGAIITWTGTALGYEYAIDNIPTAPTVAGIATTAFADTITTLSPGTTYYAHVRSSCAGGEYSAWVTIPITTNACDTVTGLVGGSSDTAGVFTWTAEPGAAGYQYIIDESLSTPLGSGTFTTATSVTVDTLTAGVTHYAHVRVVCGGGNYSGWTLVPIAEIPCAIPSFVIFNIDDTGVSLTWTAGAGTVPDAFEYAIDNDPTPPSSGTLSTNPTGDTITTLICDTHYYVHVRVVCGVGVVSPWFTDTFTTAPCLGIGIINGNPFDVQAYPNPAKDVVTVQVSGVLGNNRQVELTDVTGKVITKVRMLTNKVDVSMNNLASGIYLIRYSDDAHTQVIKVNKQ